jgi:hypothetical protein
MLKEEMKRLAGEFGLTENVDQNISDQLKKAQKLDSVDTVTFGLETDDSKIVKVFVNAKDADKFEKIMADCLGSTDSIEEAINKAAAEVDIVDVEWPEDDADDDADDEAPEDDGSEIMDPKVYGNKNEKAEKKTVAKKEIEEGVDIHDMSYGERFALNEDSGSISSRMTTVNQQLVYQAILDLGMPEVALDRSPYRGAIIKGLKTAAIELQHNGSAKQAIKIFIKKRIDDIKHDKNHEAPPSPTAGKKDHKNDHKKVDESVQAIVEAVTENELVMSEAEDGMLLTCNGIEITLSTEELERALKAIAERATTVIGAVTLSPRGSALSIKLRGKPERMQLDAPQLAQFKELAAKLLGE